MLKTYKILALLLDYPDKTIEKILPSVQEEIRKEGLIPFGLQQQLACFLDNCASLTLGDWQMIYIQQFDCAGTVNLYLYDYVRENAGRLTEALTELEKKYACIGWEDRPDELPDYLPFFLEYLSTLSSGREAADLLAPFYPALQQMEEKLTEENNFYRYLFRVLLGLAESSQEAFAGGSKR